MSRAAAGLLAALLLLAWSDEGRALRRSPDAGSRFFMEGGALLGRESDIPLYDEAEIRPYLESGVMLARRDRARLNAGLSLGVSLGPEDRRYSSSLLLTRRLGRRWSLLAAGGALWSDHEGRYSSDFFFLGWQARLALLLDDRLALSYVRQGMDYEAEGSIHGGGDVEGNLQASYLGISLRGDADPVLAVAAAVAIAVVWTATAGSAWTVMAN